MSVLHLCAGQIPVIAGVPVEEHLKAAFKKTAPTFINSRTSQRKQGTGTFLPPIKSSSSVKDSDSMKDSQVLPLGNALSAVTGGSTAGSPGTGHNALLGSRSPGKMTSPYSSTAKLGGTGQMVFSHMSLRQSVPYDTIQQAEQVERKVSKAEVGVPHALTASRMCLMMHVSDVLGAGFADSMSVSIQT